ncbi:hypothetical protein SCACP_38650 [Sporomusa carbonis]|uniref:hypothetical protein n=1 Tax=Sporomusa carbonis TaxID=3076075 RepID=UPI003A6B73B1
MNNNKNIAKCPNCGTPSQQTEITEECLLANGAEPSLDSLLATCVRAEAFRDFHSSGLGADPCEHCQHNQITETPGTFVTMKQLAATQWSEIHQCSNCKATYEVSTSITD